MKSILKPTNLLQTRMEYYRKLGHTLPDPHLILDKQAVQRIRESGLVNTHLLNYISDKLHVGMSTLEIDRLIQEETKRLGGQPATLGYNGYPKSICTSVNDEVCHGIPSKEVVLNNGDIVNIDVSTILGGYYSDSARAYAIGEISSEAKGLLEISKQTIQVGLNEVRPWRSMKTLGSAISNFVNEQGYSVVSAVGGHGIGRKFHEEPFVSYDRYGTNMLMVPGMVFTIEPAINTGKSDVYEDANNGWTIYTADSSLSAQWEVTVLVTESGYEVLAK